MQFLEISGNCEGCGTHFSEMRVFLLEDGSFLFTVYCKKCHKIATMQHSFKELMKHFETHPDMACWDDDKGEPN